MGLRHKKENVIDKCQFGIAMNLEKKFANGKYVRHILLPHWQKLCTRYDLTGNVFWQIVSFINNSVQSAPIMRKAHKKRKKLHTHQLTHKLVQNVRQTIIRRNLKKNYLKSYAIQLALFNKLLRLFWLRRRTRWQKIVSSHSPCVSICVGQRVTQVFSWRVKRSIIYLVKRASITLNERHTLNRSLLWTLHTFVNDSHWPVVLRKVSFLFVSILRTQGVEN